MSAPINEFVKNYAVSNTVRFHMPGHKGRLFHGLESLDITEIKNADYLFEPSGIIAQSEANMSDVFGSAATLYSTEGSSLCIKTMLGIVNSCRKNKSRRMLAAAPRNVHKAFINACILLDIDVLWIMPKTKTRSLCCGGIDADDISAAIRNSTVKPDCVYITSPDYLGFIADIGSAAEVCRENDIPLLCDNAHGAYLRFLDKSLHPMQLGAAMCCDSAHKTLPCYTGAAMLHISQNAPEEFIRCAKNVMSLFASTSPSYLIMQSLDLCAAHLSGEYISDLDRIVRRTELCKQRLKSCGWKLSGEEPCKLTIAAAESGHDGNVLGDMLRQYSIEPEYTDFAYVVLMISVFNDENDFAALEKAMGEIQPKQGEQVIFDEIPEPIVKMPIRAAAFSNSREIFVDEAQGKICGLTVTSCQPSVPVAVSGELITKDIIKLLKRYGINKINIVTETEE